MRIENGYLQQSMLCSKNNRNAVGNFSDTMNKAQECISNKISTRDSYVNSTDYSNFGIYTQNSISQDIELPIETERYKIEDATYVNGVAAYEIVDKQTGKDFYIRDVWQFPDEVLQFKHQNAPFLVPYRWYGMNSLPYYCIIMT